MNFSITEPDINIFKSKPPTSEASKTSQMSPPALTSVSLTSWGRAVPCCACSGPRLGQDPQPAWAGGFHSHVCTSRSRAPSWGAMCRRLSSPPSFLLWKPLTCLQELPLRLSAHPLFLRESPAQTLHRIARKKGGNVF